MTQTPTTGTTVGRFKNYGEDMLNIANPQGTVEYRIDGDADVWMTGDFNQFNGLSLVSHGLASQVARYDGQNLGAALSNIPLYTTPTATGGGSTDVNNNYSGFYRVLYAAKVTQAASVSSTLGGSGGITFTFTSADDGQILNSIPGVLNGNVGHNDLTTTWGSGTQTLYVASGTQITFSFGYVSSGATPMQYAIHVRLEDL